MFIGKISELTGVSRKAIRHYEKLGLLQVPNRKGTYRIYDERHVHLVAAIKRAQSLGFKLSELVPLYNAKQRFRQFPVELAGKVIDGKMAELKKQISQARHRERELRKLKQELNRLSC